MSARDLFGVVVRLAGLSFILFGLFDVLHTVAIWSGHPFTQRFSAMQVSLAAASWFVAGAGLFFGAGGVTRLAYGRPER